MQDERAIVDILYGPQRRVKQERRRKLREAITARLNYAVKKQLAYTLIDVPTLRELVALL